MKRFVPEAMLIGLAMIAGCLALEWLTDPRPWFYWAMIIIGADMISTRIINFDGGVEEYTGLTIAVMGAALYLPGDQAMAAVLLGSTVAALSSGLPLRKRLFNLGSYVTAGFGLVMSYTVTLDLFGGALWPSLAAMGALLVGGAVYESVNSAWWSGLLRRYGWSWRSIFHAWRRSLIYPAASAVLAMGMGTLLEQSAVWVIAFLVMVIAFLQPEYDLRRLRGTDRSLSASAR